jgi:hypothetical protein
MKILTESNLKFRVNSHKISVIGSRTSAFFNTDLTPDPFPKSASIHSTNFSCNLQSRCEHTARNLLYKRIYTTL